MEPTEAAESPSTTEQVTTEPTNPPAPNSNPTVEAPKPSINPDQLRTELASLQQSIVREQAQRIVELQQELANKNATPSAPADDAARFLEAPRQMIREELQQVVAPLIEFMGGIKKTSAYDNLKAEAKRHATFGPLLTEVEATVDRLMANSEPTPQNLQTAVFSALGMARAGLLPGAPTAPVTQPTTPPVTQQPREPVTTPPYIPPSPPAPPRSGGSPADTMKAKIAALTETEREVIRRWGCTPEQYITNRDADENATNWKGGSNV